MDAETRLKVIIGQLVMQQASLAAELEAAQAKVTEAENGTGAVDKTIDKGVDKAI